jgi:hypothetical protein
VNIEVIFEKIMLMSGQFLINTNRIEVDVDRFRHLVDDALARYSKHSPYDRHFSVRMIKRSVRFTDEMICNLTGEDHLGVPDWVSDVMPIRLHGLNPFKLFKNLDPTGNPELVQKTQLPFVYRKPELYVSLSSEMDVHAVWKHKVREVQLERGGFEYIVPTIDTHDIIFFQLLQGMFLSSIGRSRRAFTLQDLPIAMDASEIASEGQEIVDKAIEEIEDHQKFYLAWGG